MRTAADLVLAARQSSTEDPNGGAAFKTGESPDKELKFDSEDFKIIERGDDPKQSHHHERQMNSGKKSSDRGGHQATTTRGAFRGGRGGKAPLQKPVFSQYSDLTSGPSEIHDSSGKSGM